MGLYERYVFPFICDKVTSGPEAEAWRRKTLAPARGRVLEVGFGTGHNAAHYPPEVERVIGLDTNAGMESRARERIRRAPVPIELVQMSGESLPFADHSFDTVVTTLTLCSIADVERALAEFRRVLAPDGRYLLLEHGLSPNPGVQRWQRRLNGLNMRLAAGCRLDRPISALVTEAGFRFEDREEFEFGKAPKFASFTTRGSAVPAT